MKTILSVLIGFVLGFSIMFELEVRELQKEATRQRTVDAEIRKLVTDLKDASELGDGDLLRRIVKIEKILAARYEERKVSDTVVPVMPSDLRTITIIKETK